MKVALCAIARNENLYIHEWVEYYKNLGIDKIFLYDNNPIDGERFEDVINDYIQLGYVEVINVRGEDSGAQFRDGIDLQPWTYIDCYENRVSEFDWVGFFDIDEFVIFKDGFTLESFLNQDIFKNVGTIMVPWEIYDDNNLITYDSRPVMERFTHKSKKQFYCLKSFARTNHPILSKIRPNLIHFFELADMPKAFFDGTIDINPWAWVVSNENAVSKSKCIVNHYKTKTFDEFVKRLLNRNYVISNHWGCGVNVTKLDFNYVYRTYFEYNEVTSEKIKYIKEHYDYIFK